MPFVFDDTPTQGQGQEGTDKPILVPAIKTKDGTVRAGVLGDHHDDIDASGQRGFVDKSGAFLNRKEAGKVAQAAGLDVPDNLHSENLNKALGVEKTKGKFVFDDEEKQKPSQKYSAWQGFKHGLGDVATGAMQIGAKMADSGMGVPGVISMHLAERPDDMTGKTVAYAKERDDKIAAERAAAGKTGIDLPRLAGNIAGELPLAALNPLAAGAASGALTPVTHGDFATEKAEQVGLGAAGGKLGELGGNALAKLVKPAEEHIINPILAAARKAGYVVHPAETEEAGAVTNALSGLGGKIKTQQLASVKNQEITNGIAAQELGMPKDSILDDTVFQNVRQKAGKAYDAVSDAVVKKLPGGNLRPDKAFKEAIDGLGATSEKFKQDFPELAAKPDIDALKTAINKGMFSGEGALAAIRQLRHDASASLADRANPQKLELGRAQKDAANAIEELIERRLTENGDTTTANAYREARKTIAKSYDIESATDAQGNVDARKIARMGEKRPFTGGLKTIADTASAFGKSMQNPSKFGGVEKRSVLDTGSMAASTVAAMATHNPLYALGNLAPMARPLARAAVLSEAIQNRLAGVVGQKPGMISPEARNALAAIAQRTGQVAAPAAAMGANSAAQGLIGP